MQLVYSMDPVDCYYYNYVSTDMSFGLLQVFHIKLGSPHRWLVGWVLWHTNLSPHRILNWTLYLNHRGRLFQFWFGLVLWHIDHCRSFKAKSFLYMYIKYMISKHILKITFLNKTDLYFFLLLHTHTHTHTQS